MTVPKTLAEFLENACEGVQFLLTLLKVNYSNFNENLSYPCLDF